MCADTGRCVQDTELTLMRMRCLFVSTPGLHLVAADMGGCGLSGVGRNPSRGWRNDSRKADLWGGWDSFSPLGWYLAGCSPLGWPLAGFSPLGWLLAGFPPPGWLLAGFSPASRLRCARSDLRGGWKFWKCVENSGVGMGRSCRKVMKPPGDYYAVRSTHHC